MATYQLGTLASGPAGIKQTLKIMSKIVKKYKASPDVRELALSLVRNTPEKNWRMEAENILRFCQSNIRYVKDVQGVETLQTPTQTLRIGQGDCDDKSTLCASLLAAIGHPTRFCAVGNMRDRYSHVFVQTRIGGAWVNCETIEQWPLGRAPKYKSIMVVHNK